MTSQSQRLQQVPYGRHKLKTAKKDYFTKILSSPRFFEINTSNSQKTFHDIFIKFCRKEFQKKINFITKKQKVNCFFRL